MPREVIRYEADNEEVKRKLAEIRAAQGRVADDTVTHTSRMSSAWGSWQQGVEGILPTLAKVGAAATVAFGAAAALAGKYAIQAAASYEQAKIGFTGILGSAEAAQDFLLKAREFAAKTPFELPGLLKVSQQLLAVGYNANEVIPILTKIGNVAADLGVGEDAIAGVVRALGQMKGKGKASAEELIQISEQIPGFSAVAAIAKDMGITVADAFDLMKNGALPADRAIAAILKGMDEFPGAAGAMDRQSKTLAGTWSTFKDELRNAAIDGITPFIPALTGLLQAAIPLTKGLVTEVGRGINYLLTDLLPAIQRTTIAAVEWFQTHKEAAAGALSALSVIAIAVFAAIGHAATTAAIKVLAATWPILAIAAAIGLLVAGVLYAYNHWSWFHTAVDATGRFLRDDLVPTLKRVAAWVVEVAKVVWEKLRAAWDAVWSFLSGIDWAGYWHTVVTVVSAVAGALSTAFRAVVDALTAAWNWTEPFRNWLETHLFPTLAAIGEFVVAVFQRLVQSAQFLWDFIQPTLRGLTDIFQWAFNNVIVPLLRSFADALKLTWEVLQFLWGIVQAVMPLIVGQIKGAWDVIWSVTKTVWNVVKDIVWGVLQSIKAIIEEVLGVIRGIFQIATGLIKGDWGKVWEGIHTIVKSVLDGIKNSLRIGLETAKNIVGDVFSGVVDVVRNIVDDVRRMITGIPGMLGDLGSLLYNQGWNIISGLFQGMLDSFGPLGRWVGSVGGWIADHKGPMEYDRTLLTPHGQAIMGGLGRGLAAGLGEVLALVEGFGPRIGGAFSAGQQQGPVTNVSTTNNAWAPVVHVHGGADPNAMVGALDRQAFLARVA